MKAKVEILYASKVRNISATAKFLSYLCSESWFPTILFLGSGSNYGIFEWVIIALNQVYWILKNKTEPPKKQHSVLLWTNFYGEQENYKNQMENKQILTKLCTNQNFT